MVIDFPWYYVFFCLLAGAVYAAVMYYSKGERSKVKGEKLRVSLFVLRFLAVSAIALLLLAPVAKQTVNEQQKPIVVVAQDVSESVESGEVKGERLKVKGGKWEEELGSEGYEVVYEEFGGSTTDISEELTDIANRYQGQNLGAVVLATDGIYNRGSNPATTAERLSFPIYTVALGDTTPQRDAALANLRHNRIAFSGNTFPVEVTVNATRLKGQSAQLTITDGHGKVVAKEQLTYHDELFSNTQAFNLTVEKPGMQRYTVRLTVVDGERTAENNVLTFYTDVLDSRRKVAIVGNAPHPDLAALKQAVESNPNYEAEVMLAETVGTRRAASASDDYSLVIYHNLPSATHQLSHSATQSPSNSATQSPNAIYIIGTQTDLSRFNALHAGLEIVAKTKKSNEVTAVYNDRFTLFTLDGADAAALEELPPLEAPFGEAKSASNLQSLFTARLGNINTGQPLVAAISGVEGGGRSVFVWGEGLWRWRLNDYLNNKSFEHFDRLVSQMVNFAAITERRERFMVETERHYSDNDEIVIRAQLYNEAYEPFNSPDATFSLQRDHEGERSDYNFTREGDGYRLALGRLPEGLYHYTATVKAPESQEQGAGQRAETLRAEGSFAVEALHLEQANLTADHTLLKTISSITGGEMFYPSELNTLHSKLQTLKPVIYTHTRYSELLNLPWVLILIVILLGTEWVVRKYHGEV